MNGDTTPTNGTTSPSSWRDVYSLVQDVEKRLGDRIDNGLRSVTAGVSDHELRIRAIETQGSTEAREAHAMAAGAVVRVTAIETAALLAGGRSQGQRSVITYGQKAVMALVVIVNVVIAIITFTRPA